MSLGPPTWGTGTWADGTWADGTWEGSSEPAVLSAGTKVEIELAGRGNGWTDVTADLLWRAGVELQYGINGADVNDCVADPGMAMFALNNSAVNSASLAGYYSPGHANVRAGFQLGSRVRISHTVVGLARTVYKFVGPMISINPAANLRGIRATRVVATDWMDEAANASLSTALPLQVDKRADEVFQAIIGAMTIQPDAIEIAAVGQEVFPYALDSGRIERVEVLREFFKLASSDGATIYIKGDEVRGGTLVFAGRTFRGTATTDVLTLTDAHMIDLDVAAARDVVVTQMQTTIHPRKVPQQTVVLFELQSTIELAAGQVLVLQAPYRDPEQAAARVGGTDMEEDPENPGFLEPVEHYSANSAADGSGADLTTSLRIAAAFGPNAATLTLTNIGGLDMFITPGNLQVWGRGVYDYETIVLTASDASVASQVGDRRAHTDMSYQTDVRVGAEWAAYRLFVFKAPDGRASRVGVYVDETDEDFLLSVLLREPGDRIRITETQTGIDDSYFIQSVKFQQPYGHKKVYVEFGLQLADSTEYWQLETFGRSELDLTTRLGFFVAIGHADITHQDEHNDSAHSDSAHVDSHSDTAHEDAGHGDAAHSDSHVDVTHVDSHSDTSHSDVAHVDVAHNDSHADVTHTDTHADNHGDFVDDGPHLDVHGDTHNDTAHSDTHNDTAHSDTAHSDTSHSDSHSDTAHSDSHVDAGHSDAAHVDVTHVDTHDDTAHSDADHSDSHFDIAHGDA